MAAAVPQPPPMAHLPHHDGNSSSRLNSVASTLLATSSSRSPSSSHGPSLFSPASSPRLDSPADSSHATSPSVDSGKGQLMTVSGKSSFSSQSSGPASPASLSYSPAVQSALRDSCRSSTSSHNSAMASPQSLTHKSLGDLEKQQMAHRPAHTDRTASAHYHESSYGLPEPEYELDDSKAEDKAVSILLYLSGPNCLVAMVILLYTLLAVFATLLLQPFRLCTSATSFRHQIISFLAPTLRIQLNFIHSVNLSEAYSAPMLVIVNLLSPLLALGVAGASWISAAFWFFNTILGDPDGSDKPKGYNDGRASVMGVRKWWEKWLRRPLR